VIAKKRVLLVEDDRFLRRACEAGLQQRGFEVVTAVDGDEGLRAAKGSRFDLILLDLLMPKKPGIDVLTDLKADASTRDIPVLILSSSSRDEDKHRVVALGAIGYYVKANLSLRALGDEIARLLA
jgi:DNA-binding response OmpR family regulator